MSADRHTSDAMEFADEVTPAVGAARDVHDPMGIVGRMHAVLRGPDGTVKDERIVDNLIVTVGKNAIADQVLASPTIIKPTHMAVGTGTVDPAAGDTALGAEVDRNALTSLTRNTNVVTAVANWAAGDATNAALTEAGIFSQASGTDATHPMYSRAEFTPINKGANDTLQITWTWTFG
jgi:hypothetical protein